MNAQTVRWAALCVALAVAAFARSGEEGFSRSVTPGLLDQYARQFGAGARGRLEAWRQFVQANASKRLPAGLSDVAEPLRLVNGYFNALPYVEDGLQWNAEDYWATPAEFLSVRAGDCEDYAIAKYFQLKELGIPLARLRLVYARALRSGVAHMVLAYYSTPAAEPLILDNLDSSIRPASDRPDLIPVYMFNDDDLQVLQEGVPGARRDALSIRKWRELLEKLAREMTY